MASTKTNTVTEARRRAREAKAALDAERAEHDRKVEEAATAYYVAVGAIEDLEETIKVRQGEADDAVLSLLELGETPDRVAQLTGLPRKTVTRTRRAATPRASDDENGSSTGSPTASS